METEEGMDIKMNGNSPIALDREFLRECGGRLARKISLDPILKGFESCTEWADQMGFIAFKKEITSPKPNQ